MDAQTLTRGLEPMHPGELPREVILPALNVSGVPRTEIADRVGTNHSRFYDVLDGAAPVTPELAVKLSAVFGVTAEFWLALQARHDLAAARAELGDRLPARIEVLPQTPETELKAMPY